MNQESTKYRERGAYHWRELSKHPLHGWPYTRSRVEWVVRQCASSATVLEIGCGAGALLGRLAKSGKTVAGVDSDGTALKLAREMFAQHGLRGEFYPDLALLGGIAGILQRYFQDVHLSRIHPVWFVDLICLGVRGVRPVAVLANLFRLCTAIELIDKAGSSLGIFWTQAAVAARPKRLRA